MRLADAYQLVVDFKSISLRQENTILLRSLLLSGRECPGRRLRLSFQYQIVLLLFLLLNDYQVTDVGTWIGSHLRVHPRLEEPIRIRSKWSKLDALLLLLRSFLLIPVLNLSR